MGSPHVTAVDVSGCIVITTPGTYILQNSILNSNTAVCINITSPYVIFEGSGYIIDGIDNTNSIGIYIYNASSAATNVTITNVTVRDWNYGIYVRESQGGRIDNVTIESTRATTGQGLLLRSASGYVIVNSTIRSNPYGINVTSSNDNTITGTTATANTYGIYLTSSHQNTLTANNLSSNTNTGLYFVNSNNNTMISTTANSNTNNGCYLSASVNNTLQDTVANNNAYGIILSSSANTSLSTTTVNSNTNTGLQLLSSNTTVARETTASWNRYYGVLFTTSTDNTLTQTTVLGNQYGVYLTGSSNNTIAEIVASSNTNTGVYLTGSSNNTITGITASSNTNNGVYLTSSPRNTFIGATTMSNQYGFYLASSSNTTITGATASSNTNYGMYLSASGNATLTENSVNSNTNMGIYLSASDTCTLIANRADSNTNYGIRLVSSATCTLTNTSANNNLYGISLSSSNNAQIRNSTVNNNINSGLHLVTSHGNTIEETTASGNTNIGIYLDRSNNNTINGGSGTGNTYAGIYLATSVNNTLQEVNASSNTYGIYLTASPNNTLRKVDTNSNTYGMYLTTTSNTSLSEITGQRNTNSALYLTSSNYNSLNNSNLSENTNYGIYLSSSRGITVTNNYLNNTNNLGFGGTIYSNTWNVSKTAGTNIVDGPFLGGNFWGKPDWSGFSQITPDTDGDGICDGSYTLATGNIDYLPLHRPLPVANFSANITSGRVPLTVSFNDTSTGAGIGLWYWDFGDGNFSTSQNTIHIYEIPGTYDVRLRVTNDGGSDWENKTGFITVTNQTPIANFSANVISGPAPLVVSFTDTSLGSGILLWFWDFGDGGISNASNPVHLYEIPGTFNVSLFVMNDGGWDWENRTAFVNISPGPVLTPRSYIRISGGGGPTSDSITLYADHIHGGEEYAFDIGRNSSVLSIGVCPRETVRDVFLHLERILSLPDTIPGPSTDVYGYFTVSLTGSPSCSLEHAYIDFSVQKVWLSEHGIAPDEIELDAYRSTGWVSLPVASLSEQDDQVLYRATTMDLSHIYAIIRRAPPTLAHGGTPTPLDILSPLRLPGDEGMAGFSFPLNYLFLIGYGAVMFLLGFFFKACESGRNNLR